MFKGTVHQIINTKGDVWKNAKIFHKNTIILSVWIMIYISSHGACKNNNGHIFMVLLCPFWHFWQYTCMEKRRGSSSKYLAWCSTLNGERHTSSYKRKGDACCASHCSLRFVAISAAKSTLGVLYGNTFSSRTAEVDKKRADCVGFLTFLVARGLQGIERESLCLCSEKTKFCWIAIFDKRENNVWSSTIGP